MRKLKPSMRAVIKQALVDRYGIKCHWCQQHMTFKPPINAPNYATIEHLVPQSHGGNHKLDNLRLACKRCNNERNHHTQTGEHGSVTQWHRIRYLPEHERIPFARYLQGQTRPVIDGVPDDEQDGYYRQDYHRWRQTCAS